MPDQAAAVDSQSTRGLGPVRPAERVEILDILRGWALFGVLLCNMRWFSGVWPDFYVWNDPVNLSAAVLIDYLANDKFYTLFSFLFGLGFALQLSRADARGKPFIGLYVRRLIVLLLIGLVHTYLAWWNEALHVYALLGFALLLFRRRSNRTVLILATIFLIAIPASYHTIEFARPEDPEREALASREFIASATEYWAGEESYTWHVTRASATQWVAFRAKGWIQGGVEYHTIPYYNFLWFPPILGLFLLGLYVGRRRILDNVEANRKLIRRTMWVGLALGLPCTMATLVLRVQGGAAWRSELLAELTWIVGAPALTFFYAGLIALLAQRKRWHRLLAPLGAAGRTALTGYVMQTVVCVLLFYGFGLGLFGRVGPAGVVVVTLLVFTAQVFVSIWWLRYFRFGPLEWLWRSLTYGRMQPFRVERRGITAEAVA